MEKAKIKEIFTSIQGEGPFVGYKQLFIRFCGCNLNCQYCDTEFDSKESHEYSVQQIAEIIENSKDCHSVSLTGGEPLLHADFIVALATKSALPIYLETNGTLYNELTKVISSLTYISADIKLPSATGLNPKWIEHDKFFEIAKEKCLFAKMVFDSSITNEEIEKSCLLCKKHAIELILQPMMLGFEPKIDNIFMQKVLDDCLKYYDKVRLIPQVHKFINVI